MKKHRARNNGHNPEPTEEEKQAALRRHYPWSCLTASGVHRYQLGCGVVVTLRFELDRTRCECGDAGCACAPMFEKVVCIDAGDHMDVTELPAISAPTTS